MMPALKGWLGPAAEKIEFVTVCASSPSRRKFEDFVARHSLTGRNLILDRRNSDACYLQGVFPTYILIDPDGKIVEFNTARPSEILRQAAEGYPTTLGTALGVQ